MKTSRIVLLVVSVFVTLILPQTATADEFMEQLERLRALRISGFLIATTPLGSQEDYQTRAIIELGFKRNRMSTFFQQDFARHEFREGYFKYTRTDTTQSGQEWSYSFRAGKTQSAVIDSIPGQKSNRLTRGFAALTNFVAKPEGLRADLQTSGFWLSLTHSKNDNLTALLGNSETYLFWEKRGGVGIIVQPKSDSSAWVNPTAVTTIKDGEYKISIQNFLRLPGSIRLYGRIDYDSDSNKAYTLVGLALTYAKNSNLKLFYDDIPNSAIAEATFAF